MKKFIVLYHANTEALGKMATMTQDEQMDGMKLWMAWKDRLGDQLDTFGAPLFGGTRMLPDGTTEPSTKEVSGYSIVLAEDLRAALELMKDHPHYGYGAGCEIEVHEAADM